MQAFQNDHSAHEKETRIVSDYVTEQPEHYFDDTDSYDRKAAEVRSGTPQRTKTAVVERKPKATPTRDKG